MRILKITFALPAFGVALLFSSAFCYSQSIYQVEPGTKGNKIILTIGNASTSINIEELKIIETNNSEFIKIKNDESRLIDIAKESEREIEIEFDVMTEAPCNKKDTLYFQITDNIGKSWSKEIILEYTAPKKYELYQNYPNPFNPSTTTKYSIPSNMKRETANVKLIVFDILGREVTTLVNEKQQPGNYEVIFDASHLSSGTYFYRLTSGSFVKTKKFILLK